MGIESQCVRDRMVLFVLHAGMLQCCLLQPRSLTGTQATEWDKTDSYSVF